MSAPLQVLDRGPVADGIHLYEVRVNGAKVATFEDDPNCTQAELLESARAAMEEKGVTA